MVNILDYVDISVILGLTIEAVFTNLIDFTSIQFKPFNMAPIGTIGTVLLDRSNGTYWNTGTDWNVQIIQK